MMKNRKYCVQWKLRTESGARLLGCNNSDRNKRKTLTDPMTYSRSLRFNTLTWFYVMKCIVKEQFMHLYPKELSTLDEHHRKNRTNYQEKLTIENWNRFICHGAKNWWPFGLTRNGKKCRIEISNLFSCFNHFFSGVRWSDIEREAEEKDEVSQLLIKIFNFDLLPPDRLFSFLKVAAP